MNVQMNVDELRTIVIGYSGENSVESITFDYSAWVTAYGDGVLSLHIKRPMDETAYPVVLSFDGTQATWTISATDTAQAGHGEGQWVYTVGNAVKKSKAFGLNIIRSLEVGEAPDGWTEWLTVLEGLAQTTIENAQSASASETHVATMESSVETKVTEFDGTVTQALNDVDDAKDDAVTAVTDAKNTAIASVNYAREYSLNTIDTATLNATSSLESIKQSAVTQMSDLVDSAERYSDSAEDSATSASASATNASQSATSASASATNASQSATSAAESATQAEEAVASFVTDPTLTITGKAADAKATGDGISSLKEDLRLNVVKKPLSNPDGTNGQLLRTHGDGTTEWVDFGLPTDAQTAEAVEAWLDDHPEATTTVEDGSITMPKLNSALQNDLVIKADTEKAGFHDVSPVSISFYPDDRLTGVTAKYASEKNFLDGLFNEGTQNGITRTIIGNLVNLSGTGTGQFFIVGKNAASGIPDLVKGKTYHFYSYVKKSTPWENGSYFGIHDGKSYKKRQYFTVGGNEMIGWTDLGAITLASDATELTVKFDSLSGSVFADGDCIWVGMYETELVDTEQAVTGDDPYTVNVSGISCVDTATHESTAKYVVPTKQYVDEHTPDIIGYWNEHIYALPEDFGAVGDGVTDDTQAVADCIAYASTSNKAVRGYKVYRTSSPISIEYRYADVYLRELNYTGDGYAVNIGHTDIKFEFHRIISSGKGINFCKNSSTNNMARSCQVIGNEITSTGDCITAQRKTLYNTCEVRKLSSSGGNCITFSEEGSTSDFFAGEYVFRSSSCACPNGYAISYGNDSKFYDFTIEGNCKYGMLNMKNCVCVGFRHREQMDHFIKKIVDGADYNNGPLFVHTIAQGVCSGLKYISSDPVREACIDISALNNYDEILNEDYDAWGRLSYNGIDFGTPIIGVSGSNGIVIGEKMYFIGNHKVYVSSCRTPISVDSNTLDFRVLDDAFSTENVSAVLTAIRRLGTDFTIDISHSDIYFCATFGAIGYNDLTVAQHDGNTCTIYDKLGNVLFDGTNLGDGKWSLKCFIDRTSNGRYQGSTNWWKYDGTNETWEITKLS